MTAHQELNAENPSKGINCHHKIKQESHESVLTKEKQLLQTDGLISGGKRWREEEGPEAAPPAGCEAGRDRSRPAEKKFDEATSTAAAAAGGYRAIWGAASGSFGPPIGGSTAVAGRRRSVRRENEWVRAEEARRIGWSGAEVGSCSWIREMRRGKRIRATGRCLPMTVLLDR